MKTWMVALLVLLGLGSVAEAHFQMIYTPESALTTSARATIPLRLVFGHPFEASHIMNMGAEETGGPAVAPKIFGVVTPKGEWEDLRETLQPVEVTGPHNANTGFACDYRLRGMGDFVFVCDPGYYWEKDEDCYIRHVTKVIVNRGGVPTGWDEPVAEKAGIPCEIVPLDKPYAVWAGNVFRGVVLKGGKPVPHAEIEVEYLNHDLDVTANAFAAEGEVESPQDAFVTQTIRADANGVFTYGLARAGWWGFSALGLTEETKNDKAIELAALIWVQAKAME